MEDQDGNVDDDIDDEADERKAVHMCDSLDMALAWCEDCIIHANAPKLEKALAAEEQSLSNIIASNSGDGTDNVSRLTKVSNTYLNLFTASTSALNLFSDGGSSSKPANISSNSDRDTTMNTAVAATTLNKSISSKSIGAASERKSRKATFVVTTIPPHMLQLLALCPDEPSKVERLGGSLLEHSISLCKHSMHRTFCPLHRLTDVLLSLCIITILSCSCIPPAMSCHHRESNLLSFVPYYHAIIDIVQWLVSNGK